MLLLKSRADIKSQGFGQVTSVCTSSRRMPGHIPEFNRLEPHSSHDLVFKIWRNNKTEAAFGVFYLWLWVTRNQISMGTTGIFISRNIKFKVLPSINASLSDFTGFFALKTNQKIAIFVWIFTCVDFRGKITIQFNSIQFFIHTI